MSKTFYMSLLFFTLGIIIGAVQIADVAIPKPTLAIVAIVMVVISAIGLVLNFGNREYIVKSIIMVTSNLALLTVTAVLWFNYARWLYHIESIQDTHIIVWAILLFGPLGVGVLIVSFLCHVINQVLKQAEEPAWFKKRFK